MDTLLFVSRSNCHEMSMHDVLPLILLMIWKQLAA
jgi:hypothetical protein